MNFKYSRKLYESVWRGDAVRVVDRGDTFWSAVNIGLSSFWHGCCDIEGGADEAIIFGEMKEMMRKIYTALMMAVMFSVAIPALSGSAFAQKRNNDRYERNDDRYDDNYYDDEYYEGEYKRPNVYDRHRKAVNIGVATAAGAIIGGLIGGKKGALIGAGAGVATGAIVTAKQKPRNTERYFRRN